MLESYAEEPSDELARSIVEAAMPIVHKACSACGIRGEVRRDVAQNVLFKLFKASDLYTPEGWLRRVTWNECMDHFRRIGRDPTLSDDLDPEDPGSADSPYEARDGFEAILRVHTPEERQILILKYDEGLTIQEIADTIGKRYQATKKQIQRAEKRIQVRILARAIFEKLGDDEPGNSSEAPEKQIQRLERFLSSLTAEERQTLSYKYIQNLSTLEIAAKLGTSSEAAEEEIQSLDGRIREELGED
ncbi:MAG: sigma-70 family RNA polymerase sigma factor [Planctomycetota bacterium]|jgi:RNA polymerase sigma-70 factor (ECF subfamily)